MMNRILYGTGVSMIAIICYVFLTEGRKADNRKALVEEQRTLIKGLEEQKKIQKLIIETQNETIKTLEKLRETAPSPHILPEAPPQREDDLRPTET